MLNVANPTWWDSTAAQSHQVSYRFELRSFDGNFLRYLYPSEGSLNVDADQSCVRSLSLELNDDGTLIPSVSNTFLSPLSDNEIYVYYIMSDGVTTGEVLLGVFRITSFDIDFSDEGVMLSVEGLDRAFTVRDTIYAQAFQVAGGLPLANPVGTSVFKIISDYVEKSRNINYQVVVDPNIGTTTTPTAYPKVLGTGYTTPWQDLTQIAESLGATVTFSNTGDLTLTMLPNMDSAIPVFEFSAGENVIQGSRNYDADDFCNTIKFEGGGTYTAPIVTVLEPEPDTSPFAIKTIGARGVLIQNPWVENTLQLNTAALNAYQLLRGYEVALEVIPNARLDIYDPVRVRIPQIGLDSIGLITKISVPLDVADTMQIVVRVRGY